MSAAQAKSALTAVFDVAPYCVDAKLLQAELLLEEQDYGGMLPHISFLMVTGLMYMATPWLSTKNLAFCSG